MIRSLLYLLLRRILGLFRSDERIATEAELENAILRHQVAILRRQVKRPIYRSSDKAFLAAASRLLRREAWGAFLVRPETLLRWHRQLVRRKWTRPHRPPGRPALDPEIRALILRLGSENPRWGYMRIRGELLKLGIRVSATTIATVLRTSGLGPAPRRGPTWKEFLRSQAAGILACDFLTVETIRLKTLYVLVWIELETRRVHLGGATAKPDSAWVTQQARNLAITLHEEGRSPRFLIHDRDTKFAGPFGEVFLSEGAASVPKYTAVVTRFRRCPWHALACEGLSAEAGWVQMEGCSNCGAEDWRVEEFGPLGRLLRWLQFGRPAPRARVTCRNCGTQILTHRQGFQAVYVRRRTLAGWWGAPIRVVRVLLHARTAIPAPWIYLAAGAVGTLLGLALDLVLGWPWWAVALGMVAGVWIVFLRTAFKAAGQSPVQVSIRPDGIVMESHSC